MATKKSFRRLGALLVSMLLAPGALVAACSDDNSNPVPPVYTLDSGTIDTGTPATQTDSSTGADATGDSSQSTSEDSAADTNPIATQQDGAPIPDASPEACTTDAGCWSCTPTTTPEFLNQCTSSQCSPFDNWTRLPNYDGGLPPLP
jgi:hypothetical protein